MKLGDVVAADKVYYYESGKWCEGGNGEAEFYPRPMVYNSGYRLVEQAKALARKDDWQKLLDSDDLETFGNCRPLGSRRISSRV